ncbi:MAG: hypothetical protein WA821_19745 [Anaerolineales bacterium]
MSNDLKQKIAQNAWLIAILSGTLVFLLSYFVTTGLAGWSWSLGLIVAVVLFTLFAAGTWLVANNVVDAYTLDAADDVQNVYRLVAQIRATQGQIQDKALKAVLANICKHTQDLVAYTKRKQPSNLLSCCVVLKKWLELIVNTTLVQIQDIQARPEYHKDAQASLANAQKGFDGFDTFLVNSIKTIADGSNMEFENAAKMLDASRYNVV